MTELNASQARIPTKTFNNVLYKGERIRIRRRDGAAVVLISEDDLKLLEAYENILDARAAEQALAEMEARGEKPIPWETVKKEAGL